MNSAGSDCKNKPKSAEKALNIRKSVKVAEADGACSLRIVARLVTAAVKTYSCSRQVYHPPHRC